MIASPLPRFPNPSFRRPRQGHLVPACLLALLLALAGCRTGPWKEPLPSTWEGTHALLAPPRPPSPWSRAPRDPIDPSTLDGKVMAGYQGWFVAHDDGSGLGWNHYGAGLRDRRTGEARPYVPGTATIDLWPDMTEAGRSERYPTGFRFADGSKAEVFTSRHPDTIDRHFRWMREYGIDGVFLQRFVGPLSNMGLAAMRNQVLAGVRAGAARHGRTWALMYDLSGAKAGTIEKIVMDDWRRLVDIGGIRNDPRLQRHNGRPVVALWGIGFGDKRLYTLEECERLVHWLKEDPVYGGNAVFLGVPYHWRQQGPDSTQDPALHRVIAAADIVSPWAVGRLRSPEDARERSEAMVSGDLAWTRDRGLGYMPVIHPGFSWHNLQKTRGTEAPLNAIPRQGGAFFRSLAEGSIAGGARMLYVAMFDELDEGTAVMKVNQRPPVGENPFVGEPDVPGDHYLRLTGEIRETLRRAVAGTQAATNR